MPKHAKDMPDICQRYSKDMQKIQQRYAKDMLNICQKYAKNIPKICQRYGRSKSGAKIQDNYLKQIYAKYILKIYQR